MTDQIDFAKLGQTNPDLLIALMNMGGMQFYPLDRPERAAPPNAETHFAVHLDRPKQVIRGLGFEIMSDSIGSGNVGLPEETTGVPHDLVPMERTRLYQQMLKGFRYCRLAGGLFWRGLDPDGKQLQPRWPAQLAELCEMVASSGVEGLSFEYWSPPPFWKANRAYTGADAERNRLRCFSPDFASDPDYHGDVERFLADFAAACVTDLRTVGEAGIPVKIWNMQAEPFSSPSYSTCLYTPEEYARAFKAVAPAVRAFDPGLQIIADTSMSWDFPYVRPLLEDPHTAALVDALVIHLIGYDSKAIRPAPEPSGKPRYNNEFEYLHGPATPARCLNTIQNVMDWFQLADAPTWFWLHALKPYTNQEASGYSLGYWRPSHDADDSRYPLGLEAGHWFWNKYNWHAVGSFLRHMPWDCRSMAVTEQDGSDPDLRILAFLHPDGKLTVALSNRSFVPHTFVIETGRAGAVFHGCRYTPESAGADCRGVPLGDRIGPNLSPQLPDMSWEFWEEA
jgi:hypothetical protein